MDEKTTAHKGGERIAKTIARAGLASRREAEAWIAAGRVAVNGAVVDTPALNVSARDRITIDGEPLPGRERTRLFLYHKPRGLIATHADPQGRPTIFDQLPKNLPRLISVGRLDFNTEGLLLLTNDGALARVLELPATGWLRRYRVRAHGSVMQPQLDELRAGITVDGIAYGAIDAHLDRVQGSNLWLTFAIREGKNREVRNVLGHLGLTVTRLIRLSFGPFQLGELAEGGIEEVRTRVLREQLGERLIALSGVDFSAPTVPSRNSPSRDAPAGSKDKRKLPSHSWRAPSEETHVPSRNSPSREIPAGSKDKRKLPSHSWRAPSEETHKPLRRKFHGSRRDDTPAPERHGGEVRAQVLTDRKGRRVAVERFGHAPPPEPPKKEKPRQDLRQDRSGRRRSADRAGGPRPSRPRKR
jgi:23S rRNA pseudouridine2605 synthase